MRSIDAVQSMGAVSPMDSAQVTMVMNFHCIGLLELEIRLLRILSRRCLPAAFFQAWYGSSRNVLVGCLDRLATSSRIMHSHP